jgi:uncharacterized protein YdaU (DUF1376 family)
MNYYRRYIGDYQRDTMHLSLVEHGAYTMLLDSYYAQGGNLPDSRTVLLRLTRAVTDDEKKAVMRVADQFFPVVEGGRRRNPRADRELAVAIPLIEVSRRNGSKGGRPATRADKQDNAESKTQRVSRTEPTGLAIQPPASNHQPPETSHQPPTPNRQRELARAGFAEFWARYPRKAGEAKTLEAWNALAPDAKLCKAMLAALDEHRASRQWADAHFIPYPATWLSQRRWEDEVPRQATGRGASGNGQGAAPSAEVAQAWARVAAALRGSKAARDEAKSDATTEQVIAEMGGWSALRGVLERDMPFKAKEFQGLYRAKTERLAA